MDGHLFASTRGPAVVFVTMGEAPPSRMLALFQPGDWAKSFGEEQTAKPQQGDMAAAFSFDTPHQLSGFDQRIVECIDRAQELEMMSIAIPLPGTRGQMAYHLYQKIIRGVATALLPNDRRRHVRVITIVFPDKCMEQMSEFARLMRQNEAFKAAD